MSIASNFPAIKPTLLLDFANTEELDSRVTFTRASTATYYGTETAKAEENLLTQSQTFDVSTAFWGPINATITANAIAAPDGTTTAETFTDDVVSGSHLVQQILSGVIVNTTYVFSCFLKAGTNNYAYLSFRDSGTGNRYFSAEFDLSTGAVNRTSAGSSGTLTTQSITAVGSGWYRCVIIGQVAAAGSMRAVIGLSDGTSAYTNFGAITYTGTGTSIFAWGAQLEQRSAVTAYTVTTDQPITNYIPVLETAASGVARFDHNPTTFESLGLLIEELRSNLVLQSEDFTTTWATTRATIGANTYVSPGGTLTADTLIDTSDNDTHFVSQSVTTTAVAITFSAYAKAAGRNFVYLSINDSGNVARTTFYNLSTGAVGTTGTGITASIVSVGNGWYRCIATVGTALAGSNPCVIGAASADNTASYAGNGFSGVAIWGAQVE